MDIQANIENAVKSIAVVTAVFAGDARAKSATKDFMHPGRFG